MLYHRRTHRYIGHGLIAGLCLILISCGGMNEEELLKQAKNHLEQGNIKAASLELRNTLQRNNENAEALYLLANINLKTGDHEIALRQFKRAGTAGWNKEQVQLAKARIYFRQGELQRLLDEITDNNSWSIETRANISSLRALAEAGLGHTDAATVTLNKAKTFKTDALHVLKTTTIFQLSDLLDGSPEQTIKEALLLYPANIELLFLHASIEKKNMNLSRASDSYRKIIELEPAHIITPYHRNAALGLARIQITQNNHTQAITTLEKVLTRFENDPEANFLSALATYGVNDFKRAESHLDKVLSVLPEHGQSLRLMGKINYTHKDYQQAAQNLASYLTTNPDDLAVQKLLAQTWLFLQQPEKARAIIEALPTDKTDAAITLNLRSQLQFQMGDAQAGIESLLKIIKLQPDNISLREQLIKAYIASAKTDLALNEIKIFQRLSNNTETSQRLTISAYMATGKINQAIKVASQMLENEPENPAVIALNGALHATNNDLPQARKFFTQARQLQTNLPSATLGLARLERKEGNLDQAIILYQTLIELNQNDITPMLALSEIAALQKRPNDMLSWLEKARAAAPEDIRARIILTDHYLRNSQPNTADIYLQEALTTAPEHAKLLTLHGRTLIAQQRYRLALLPLNKRLAEQPDSIATLLLLGETHLRMGETEQARKHLQAVLKNQQGNMIATILMAETELISGNHDSSLKYAKKIQQAQPELFTGYLLEGNVWMSRKDNAKASAAYTKAWQRQQTATLAKKLFHTSKELISFDEAIKPMILWLNQHPEDTSTRSFLAAAYLKEKQHANAIREYEAVLELTPNDSDILNNLAWLYHIKNDPKALDMAARAFRYAPDNPSIQDTYGWILTQRGQPVKGLRLIRQALLALPDNPYIRFHFASALIDTGDIEQGKQVLKKLLDENLAFTSKTQAQELYQNTP